MSLVCFGFIFVFSLSRKMVGIPMQKVSYIMFKVDVEIANICFVLLCLSENGGCAGVTERRQLHIFLRCVGVCSLCNFTLHRCVSFVGLYALWLVFNTVSAFKLKAAFGYAGWHMSHYL